MLPPLRDRAASHITNFMTPKSFSSLNVDYNKIRILHGTPHGTIITCDDGNSPPRALSWQPLSWRQPLSWQPLSWQHCHSPNLQPQIAGLLVSEVCAALNPEALSSRRYAPLLVKRPAQMTKRNKEK